MNDSAPQPEVGSLPTGTTPFKDWSECFKLLKKMPHPIPDGEKTLLVQRVKDSPLRKQIAFQFLLQTSKAPAKFEWMESTMVSILGDGDEEPDLAGKEPPGAARTWVFREFNEVRNANEWKRFIASGRHLWVLLAILKAAANKWILVESLTAFSECAEHCLNTSADGRRRKSPISDDDPKWIAGLIKGRVPKKLDLPKASLDALFAVNSTAGLAEEIRRESNGLHSRIKDLEEAIAAETLARQAAEGRVAKLEGELLSTQKTLGERDRQLAEERLHSTRQGGFNLLAKSETINEVLARVRQGVAHRLENIRAYADREKPEREEIIALVGEIEKHLRVLRDEFKQ
ncbi:MAG: hypothetical protein H0U23_02590 [Blastocatellia bacterium]|nr:hypothetical protein [Blastocatellia bacterium]